MPRRITFLLLWLALTEELQGAVFGGKWSTPLTTIDTAIFMPLPGIKMPIWDMVVLAALAMAGGAATKGVAKPVRSSMKVALAAVGALWLFGVVRGGSVRQTLWQLHPFVIAVVFALLLAATCRTAKHVFTLGKVVVSAAIYRAFVLLYFYFTIARGLDPPLPVLTTHNDTVLFVTGEALLVVYALERRSLAAIASVVVASAPILLAIKLNNRRLAWLSLGVSLSLVYWVLPRSRFKRRLNLAMCAGVPVLVAYLVVGWGHSDGIFKPVGAISTMFGKHEDTSSEMRDIENFNLLQTFRAEPILGTGWGHEYTEVSHAISIETIFPQYRYIPHNSALGLLAFSGLVGFVLTWQLFVVTAFFHAIAIPAARAPPLRAAGIVGLTTVLVFVLQVWGDMGWNELPVDVMLATSVAVAARLPVLVGAWPDKPLKTDSRLVPNEG